ncbi:MAG: CPBP family intramembrane glutamic endopeptidase [Thermoanaerobaculia bacterium]
MATISLFVAIYLATVVVAAYVARLTGLEAFYWPALLAAAVATTATVGIMERGRWNIGLVVPPALASREFVLGIGFAAVLIAGGDLLIELPTSMRHTRGAGFPWLDLLIVYVPAAFHEEIVFRGYVFQKMRVWNRGSAIIASSVAFAALHTGNPGITPIAVLNLLFAGVFLSLAYERYGRLWFPIGIHLGWNLVSGPILGYTVSGFVPAASVLRVLGSGPDWLTGGEFGLEGSVAAAVVEVVGIALLLKWNAERRVQN